ncbi:MAG TPA: hypothetical protein VI819_03635 [Patescibacteria group bacterium]|nr:hypothetical protein [Patescibacteria group bacterium]
MLRKIIASLLLIVFLLTQTLSYASAQETYPWYSQSYKQWFVKVYDQDVSPPQEIFGERYTAAQVSWVIYSLIAFVQQGVYRLMACIWQGGAGQIGSCLYQNLPFPPVSENLETPQKSVLATLFPEERQLSFVNYVRHGARDLSLTPTAYAQQGFGFQALGPLQNIWRVTRDITYGFFVLIIIIFAFMIMFRVKINPQTVVTIQSAIPKIIITLIMVTFSYAIAGLLIDFMYVAIGLVALIIDQADLILPNGTGQWGTIFGLLTDGPTTTTGATGILGWFIVYMTNFWAGMAAATDRIGELFQGNIIAGGVSDFIAFFIIIAVTIWLITSVVKVFILLIRTYISIFLSIIFSPLMIGFGALLPGGGFWSWIKGVVSNLLVYPLAGILMILATIFLTATYPGVSQSVSNGLRLVCIPAPDDSCIRNLFDAGSSQYWYPPLTLGTQGTGGGDWDPLPILWLFASLGIITTIPHVANIAKGLLTGRMPEKSSDLEGVMAAAGGYLGASAGRFGRGALGLGSYAGGGLLNNLIIRGAGTWNTWAAPGSTGIRGLVGRQMMQIGEKRGIVDRRGGIPRSPDWRRPGETG